MPCSGLASINYSKFLKGVSSVRTQYVFLHGSLCFLWILSNRTSCFFGLICFEIEREKEWLERERLFIVSGALVFSAFFYNIVLNITSHVTCTVSVELHYVVICMNVIVSVSKASLGVVLLKLP